MFYFNTFDLQFDRLFPILLLLVLSGQPLFGQNPSLFPFDTTKYELREEVYKTTPQADLKLHFYYPQFRDGGVTPAILFFFGGGWSGGNHQHFANHSKYLASRGMIAVTADYRVKKEHDTTPIEAIQDARDALFFLATRGSELGIDTARLAVGGGSAGGHLALCTALIDAFDGKVKLNYQPKALVLFNPVVNTTSQGFGSKMLGSDTLRASPVHNLDPTMPPAVLFHGSEDTTVPLENIDELKTKMDRLGVESTVYVYPDQKHGFFNANRQPNHQYFLETLYRTDQFLVDQGYLKGQPFFDLTQD